MKSSKSKKKKKKELIHAGRNYYLVGNKSKQHTNLSRISEEQRGIDGKDECLNRYSASLRSFLSWLSWKCKDTISCSSFETVTSNNAILDRSSWACINMKKGHHNIKSLLKYKNEKLVIELLENDVCVYVWEQLI